MPFKKSWSISMHKEFLLPDLGEGLTSAKITQWYVSVGQNIKEDQLLCAVETTKAIIDIPAPFSGEIIELSAQVGMNVATGAALCIIASKDSPLMGRARAKNAREQCADTDVLIKTQNNLQTTTKHTGFNANGLTAHQASMFQKISTAHKYVAAATLTELAEINTKVTTSQLAWALTQTLKDQPIFNAAYSDNIGLKYFETIDIGLAIQGEKGLYMACLENCAQYTENEFAEQIKTLKNNLNNLHNTKKARMTLSNIGSTGVGLFATPSIMPPGLATLAIGRTMTQAVWRNNSVHPQTMLPLSLSFDHRIITGADATHFLMSFLRHLSEKV